MTPRVKLGLGLGLAGAVLVVALALPLANLLAGHPGGTALALARTDDPDLPRLATLLEGHCAYCHVQGAARPFYARLPLASALIERDVAGGLASLDLVPSLFGSEHPTVSEAALAKIQLAATQGTMPPTRFLALHWNGGLDRSEQQQLSTRLRAVRARLLASPGVPEALRGELVRPLPAQLPVDPTRAALGNRLYHDRRLSGDDTLSCASCHDLSRGGTDQAAVSTGIGGQRGGINSPTTFNAGLQFRQFWDGRAATLEAQADGPPNNPVEMGSNWPQIVGKLSADEEFRREFEAAYPAGLHRNTISHALASFERTLLTPHAPFDRFLQGEAGALDEPAQRGWASFQTRGCTGCHVGELLGGRSFERLGRRADYFARRGTPLTDADQGRFAVTQAPGDRHRFKVPTLRNIARTAPYFHDGAVPDLATAVRTMAVVQRGAELSPAEVADQVRFLESLTGTYQGKPL